MELVRADLRAAVIEQIMRAADDELSLLPFLDVGPCSTRSLAALGRLLDETAVSLRHGSPLAVFCQGGDLDAGWRAHVEARPGSLWQTYEMLEALYGAGEGITDPYDAYCELRARSEADFAED